MDSTVSLKFYEKNGYGDYIKDKIPSSYEDVGDKRPSNVLTQIVTYQMRHMSSY